VPIVAPVIGALVGGGLYRVLVERHLPDEDDVAEDQPTGRVPAEDD
jgi:glycerol uptake facilitator protein